MSTFPRAIQTSKFEPSSDAGFTSGGLEIPGCMRDFPLAQSYPPSIRLFEQGARAQETYFIEQGVIKLVVLASQGQEMIVGIRPSGRMVGLAPVILDESYRLSAVTVTECRLQRIAKSLLVDRMSTDFRFSEFVHIEQGREASDQLAHLVSLRSQSARDRLESLLLRTARKCDQNGQMRMPPFLKQSEIAQLIGVTPQHLSNLFRRLEDAGIIRREKGWTTVCRPDLLAG